MTEQMLARAMPLSGVPRTIGRNLRDLLAAIVTERPIIERESGLHKGLTKSQVVMIALGGSIGTGLFAGSSLAIGYAGPSVILSYAIAGFIGAVMVFSLSEMAVVHPSVGSFGLYAEAYLSPWIGFVVRYTYWAAQVIAVGGEAVAAGVYMTYWFPGSPIWIWSIAFGAALIIVNAQPVKYFGTFEYWFAFIKVAAITGFIALGFVCIFGVGVEPIGARNLVGAPGGFFPHGMHGTWLAVILGVFAFNGIEVIAVTSGETADPARAIPAALRTMGLRLFLFYVLGLTVVVSIAPWTVTAAKIVKTSPFVQVLNEIGIRQAAGVMNFVVLSAALSSMNTSIYLCGRMLFSLSRGGYAPLFLGKLSKGGSPLPATILSGVCMLTAAAASRLTPRAYTYLLGVALFGAIIVWMSILASHLAFRARRQISELPVRMPFFPWMQIAGLALLLAVLITMGLDPDWKISWIVGIPWLSLLSLAYFIRKARTKSRNSESSRTTDVVSVDEA